MISQTPPAVLCARVLQLLLDGKTWTKAKIDRGLTQLALAGVVKVMTIKLDVMKFGCEGPSPLDRALISLVESGLVSSPRPSVYQITATGRQVAAQHPKELPKEWLALPKFAPKGIRPLDLSLGGDTGSLSDSLAGSQGVNIGGVGPASIGGPGSGSVELGGGGGGSGLGSLGGGGGLGTLGTGGRGAGQGYGSGRGKIHIEIKPLRKTGQKSTRRLVIDPLDALDDETKPTKTAVPFPTGAAKAPPEDALSDHLLENKKIIPVWYGTNRKPKDLLREQDGFLDEADQIMHYGYCMVNVPKRYVKGGSGRSWLWRFLTREPTELEFGNTNPLSEEDYWSRLVGTLRKQTDANSLLLFVHGYNVSFENAANSAGQLSYELDLPVAFFSWSSHCTLKDYPGDRDQAAEAVPALKKFLGQLWQSAASTGKKLHVIAHSMGNQALLQTLHDIALAARPDGPQLAQVIFAAPDVSRTLFLQQLAEVVKQPGLTAGRTLYASSDKALLLSGVLQDNKRAGFLPPATTGPELNTIDVSRYDLSLLGHSYIFNLGPVLEDISAVLHGGKPRLRSRERGALHWVLG